MQWDSEGWKGGEGSWNPVVHFRGSGRDDACPRAYLSACNPDTGKVMPILCSFQRGHPRASCHRRIPPVEGRRKIDIRVSTVEREPPQRVNYGPQYHPNATRSIATSASLQKELHENCAPRKTIPTAAGALVWLQSAAGDPAGLKRVTFPNLEKQRAWTPRLQGSGATRLFARFGLTRENMRGEKDRRLRRTGGQVDYRWCYAECISY